ncbi:MAG: hypothetical protein ABEI78_01180 [Candidatus Nanohaloarchaea archaeon]
MKNQKTLITLFLITIPGLTAGYGGEGLAYEAPISAGKSLVTLLYSMAHITGIITSLFLIYYSYKVYQKFKGGVIGETALFNEVAAFSFLIAFLSLELEYGFGIEVIHKYIITNPVIDAAVHMSLFVITLICLGISYYKLSKTVE